MSYNHKEHCEPIQKAYEKVLHESMLLEGPTLTRQHFNALADIMKRSKTLDELKNNLLDWIKTTNPNFDENRFRSAAGM